jgi:adenosylcobinamide-phosphate synthase
LVSEPMINGAGRAVATVADVETGVSIFYRACGSLTVLAAITTLFFSIV